MSTADRAVRRITIVGAGLAGASAAAALRDRGFDGAITLFTEQKHEPYELPPLSKAILLGDTDEPDWVRPSGFYADHDIDLRMGTGVTELRLADHSVRDGSGGEHGYDRLLLATGSRPRTLPGIADPAPDGVLSLRTLTDSLALRSRLVSGSRIVIIGAGWIGCEVAAAARKHGAKVTVVDPLPLPLYPVVGDQIGTALRDLHTGHGVEFRLGVSVDRIDGGDQVHSVRLDDGDEVPADTVVVAIGAAPRLELARTAGLELASGGVAVDTALRTSAPDVYAAGDLAAQDHPRYPGRIRVEHWANAKDQGTHVAGGLLGETTAYTASPYFFSDQYDLGCEYRGLADAATDRLVMRGSLDSLEFTAFWVNESNAVMAAMNVNVWDDGDALQRLVDERVQVTDDALVNGDLASL